MTTTLRASLLAVTAALACACGGAAPAKPPAAPVEEPAEGVTAEPETPDAHAEEEAQPAPPPDVEPGYGIDRSLDTLEDAHAALAADQRELDLALREPIPTAELGVSACRRVCRAIGSMRRSVDAICRLAGEDDQRCRDARDTLGKNQRRIADAGCSC